MRLVVCALAAFVCVACVDGGARQREAVQASGVDYAVFVPPVAARATLPSTSTAWFNDTEWVVGGGRLVFPVAVVPGCTVKSWLVHMRTTATYSQSATMRATSADGATSQVGQVQHHTASQGVGAITIGAKVDTVGVSGSLTVALDVIGGDPTYYDRVYGAEIGYECPMAPI